MPRTILAALVALLAALLLLAPATSASSSRAKLRGTVAATFPDNNLIRVDSRRLANILLVPGSQARIHVGQRVTLRGTTLRQHGHRSRVLARSVRILRSVALRASSPVTGGSLAPVDDDELEVKGTLASLSPVTVKTAKGSAVCVAPAGMSLAGFAVGDFVEMTCDLLAGVWTVRKLEHEDDDDVRGDDDDDDNSGPGNCNDANDDQSGSATCDEDNDDDDHSGHGRGGDDDHGDDSGHGGHGNDD